MAGWGWVGGATPKTYRAAIIGRTGGGDYGHGYDAIFNDLPNVTVEAVADAQPEGLKKAAARSGAKRQYLDFREMLQKEKPDLVCIAPRQPDCHLAMALAAIEAGAHLFMEKPFAATIPEADQILAAAERHGTRIAVAHTRRFQAGFQNIKALIEAGFPGAVREVRIEGKQDQRAGGEDLIVLGTHDFDLMRYYFGDPLWCFAVVTQGGRDATLQDIRRGAEPIRVAGDTIHASFGFPGNIHVTWDSTKTADPWNTKATQREKWAFEIYGTKRIIASQAGLDFAWLDSPFLAHLTREPAWKELPEAAAAPAPPHQRHPIRNLIHAIENHLQPACSGYDGRWAIDMVAAVYQSHFQRRRIDFPLLNRTDPLEKTG